MTSKPSPTRPAPPSCLPSEVEVETRRPPDAQPRISTLRRRRKQPGYRLFSDGGAGESGLSSAPMTDSEDGVPAPSPPYDDELETVPKTRAKMRRTRQPRHDGGPQRCSR
jgi:hypothetical protein